MMTHSADIDAVVDRVAWALHAWSCPLCYANGPDAMAESDQDHVTGDDRLQAHFLIGALGLTSDIPPEVPKP